MCRQPRLDRTADTELAKGAAEEVGAELVKEAL
jgi:hypothetical protein